MKTKRKQLKRGWAAALALFTLFCLVFTYPKPVSAFAAYSEPCEVHYYTVNATVNTDRTIVFEEEISFTMLITPPQKTFYRSLPLEGDRYFHIKAESPNNEEFFYDVADNPDVDGFMDINCYGGVEAGNTLVYKFFYVMEVAEDDPSGMIIDFIGAGWPMTLSNVTVNITFPSAVGSYTVYSDYYGGNDNKFATVTQSADKTQMTLTAETLPLVYNETYGETVAAGITLDFTLGEGVFDGYASTRIAKPTVWIALAVGVVCLAAAILLLWVCRKKPLLTPVVNFKPPEGMDPLRMGKFIDGTVENEDVTSMIFYFASKGYLTIGLDEDEPVLTRTGLPFPNDAPAYQRTLFDGLFKSGDRVELRALKNEYYKSIDAAKMQLSVKDIPRYEKKSVAFSALCAALGFAVFFLTPLLIGLFFVGGGYLYTMGAAMAFPVLGIFVLGYLKETRKHKGKGANAWTALLTVVVMAVGFFLCFFSGNHLLTETEKIIMLAVGYAVAYLSPKALTVTKRHNELLSHVVGFKEFITVTEKDKIKFMLQENPELFYDILPYAQVLGVTDEWEDKFKDVTLASPSWYTTSPSPYDYWYMSRCMRRASIVMLSRPQEKGSGVGRSGGGGGFGGFSGGGRGGGGGGFR